MRYELEEDPKTTLVIAMPLPQGRVYQHLELGPNNVLAASYEGMVHLLSATTGGCHARCHQSFPLPLCAAPWPSWPAWRMWCLRPWICPVSTPSLLLLAAAGDCWLHPGPAIVVG